MNGLCKSFPFFRGKIFDLLSLARSPSGKSLSFSIESVRTVHDLRREVKVRLGHDFRLQFKGKQLQDGKLLRDYDVNPGSTVFIIGRLKGGPVKNIFELSFDAHFDYRPFFGQLEKKKLQELQPPEMKIFSEKEGSSMKEVLASEINPCDTISFDA